MSTLLIKPTDDETKEFYIDHKNYNEGDSGLDLFFPEDVTFKPHETKLVSMKIKCEMVELEKNVSYYLYARSSIYKTPLILANSVGIIDAGYRGEIMGAFRYIPRGDSDEEYTVKKGTRLLQICARDLSPFSFSVVDELSETRRGEGGFGSTGKN